ncbi:MAG: hypothetical protein JOZ72_03645 [Alphaproteobacteria bacterium]|nr:hypothetical protein [Alphaproteobacteria bacterium]
MKGKWRIVEMPDFGKDYLDLMEPAYILFDGEGSGEFAFGCVTGGLCGGGTNTVHFTWDGNSEMDEAGGHGWAELQPDGSLVGEIDFDNGDEAEFIAKPWDNSSTAC